MNSRFRISGITLVVAGASFLLLAVISNQAQGNGNPSSLLLGSLSFLLITIGVLRIVKSVITFILRKPDKLDQVDVQPSQQQLDTETDPLKGINSASLYLWPFALFAAFMGFDAPNSTSQVWPWLVLGFVLAFPWLNWQMSKFAHAAQAVGHRRLAYFLAVIPILPFVFPFLFSAFFIIFN